MALSFGHRLELLHQAWGFKFGDRLADAMFLATGKSGPPLNQATVNRWRDGGTPRDHDVADLAKGFAKEMQDRGVLDRFRTDQAALVKALLSDDLAFVRYCADRSAEPLPVPEGIYQFDEAKAKFLADDFAGRFLFYRLGIVTKGHKAFLEFDHFVLHRIPVEIVPEGRTILRYRDAMRGDGDALVSSAGFAVRTREFVTIQGEDAERPGRSELFLTLIHLEDRVDGWIRGVTCIRGDLGRPTACRIVLRDVGLDDRTVPWEDFVGRHATSFRLDKGLHLAEPDPGGQDGMLQECIVYLSLKGMSVDLRF
jgi:hypothetical protein